MKTPIVNIADLPPIITFSNSQYELGFSFPLTIGIFANGKAHSFPIKPQQDWPLAYYDQRAGCGKPLAYFEQHGLELEMLQDTVNEIIGDSEFIFYLRDGYDSRFLHLLCLDNLQARDIDLIDTFDNYGQRHAQIIRRMQRDGLNMYSVEDVVATLAELTFDNLKYQSLKEIVYVCHCEYPIG